MTLLEIVFATLVLLVAAGAVWRYRHLRHEAGRAHAELQKSFETQRRLERTQAATEERERIYRDLHDDIGAKLLTLVHSLDAPEHADLARSVLQDLRDIVSRSRGAAGPLHDVLARMRDETEQRLELLGNELRWEQPDALPNPDLEESQALHLFRILREAVSNAIRHGRAHRVTVRLDAQGDSLVLQVADDGPGFQERDPALAGRGVEGMKTRAAELQGTIQWNPATEGGTKVVLRMPLPR